MPAPIPDVPRLDALTACLRAQPDVAAAWIFGSRARGDHRPGSDVDVAVLGARGWEERPDRLRRRLRLWAEAADALELPDGAVDLIVLQDAPPSLALAALHDAVLLFDRDPSHRVEFQVAALHRGVEAADLRGVAMRARSRRYSVEGSSGG
ncbi:nucleotidyltransferase domain-containing protein [Myxococcota bacterium]|nr:nucleotidyltransferase domain-containing protein [Myxococcota bacterium]